MITIDTFLSAYDPPDLPGDSIDPLGFERGYLFLAEKLLPGLTNVASRPRYLGMLCAGVRLAPVSAHDSPRRTYEQRLATVLRLERLWALANVLVTSEYGPDTYPEHGIRGLRYAQARHRELERKRATKTDADFKLLVRQAPYGVIGIYGAVAERLRFVSDRRTLTLSPALGDRLGEEFIKGTRMPADLQAAVRDERKPISLDRLADWGARAHVSAAPSAAESACLEEALHADPVRSRMAGLLEHHPANGGDELKRLRRIRQALEGTSDDQDLRETIDAILAFEGAYRSVLLAFDRVLRLCSQRTTVPVADAAADVTLRATRDRVPKLRAALDRALSDGDTEHFRRDLRRLDDVTAFLGALSEASDAKEFVRRLVRRHEDVQRGKLDRGRRKAPWVALEADVMSLTMQRVGGSGKDLKKPSDITPHFYRTEAADALLDAAAAVADADAGVTA